MQVGVHQGSVLSPVLFIIILQAITEELNTLEDDDQCVLLWRAGLLENKDKVKTICLHHEQFFGKVFERKADKCCGVLKSHRVKKY